MRGKMTSVTNPSSDRVCDYCGESMALLYCRADSAKLCFSCDREVHSTNQLFSKHARSRLCDGCDASPASIYCETERAVLCQTCDWERHSLSPPASGGGGGTHCRRPLEGFTGCPSACELLSIVGLEGSDLKGLSGDGGDGYLGSGIDGFSDLFIWDTPSFVNLDDLIASTGSGSEHNFQAMGVPPLPKNRNACCGQYKDEVLLQLRELGKVEPVSDNENVDCKPDIRSLAPGIAKHVQHEEMVVGCAEDQKPHKAGMFRWCTDSAEAMNEAFQPSTFLRSCHEENSVVPDQSFNFVARAIRGQDNYEEQSKYAFKNNATVFPKGTPNELTSEERDYAISRYKEKKRTRRYDKHVRYESRKARAETRTRIKGRFAKIDQ